MLGDLKFRRRNCGAILLIGVAASCSACQFLPGLPSDVPIAMHIQKGEPEFAWCGEQAILTKLQIFYSEGDGQGAEKVIEGEGEKVLKAGDTFAVSNVPNEWILQDIPGQIELEDVKSVGLNLYFESEKGTGGMTIAAEFNSPSEESVLQLSDRKWFWANGETSEQPCGMPSAE